MQHAYQAIVILQSKLLQDALAAKNSGEQKDEAKEIRFKDRMAVLTMAYHNLAVQQEFLKMYAEAIQSYREAW